MVSEYVQEVDGKVKALLWCSEGGIIGDPHQWIEEQGTNDVVMRRLRMSTRAFNKTYLEIYGEEV